jgi:hypothetical protein
MVWNSRPCFVFLLIKFRKYLHKVLTKPGPFSDEDWVPGPETISALESSKILYVYKKQVQSRLADVSSG